MRVAHLFDVRGLIAAAVAALSMLNPLRVALAAPCSEDWICIDAADANGGITLTARNLRSVPVTFTLDTRTTNLQPDKTLPLTITLGADERRQVLRLSKIDEQESYRFRYWYDWTIGETDAASDPDYVYALPYATGESYRVLQGFGAEFSHTGLEYFAVDFDMTEGTPVHAARGGRVARIVEHNDRGCWEDGCGKFANYIVVLHDDGTTGEYYHLRRDGALVEPGERIERGQKIGLSGNTGHTTMPHLHFAVYRATEWGRTQSLAIRFETSEGVVDRIRSGRRYRAR